MQRKFFTHWIILGLIGLGWMSEANAQTITTGALAVTKVCGSDNLAVPFAKTGTFGATNVFSVELSDAAGSFATPLALTTTGASSPLSVVIPASVPAGTGYRVRVVSSVPLVAGSTSATVLSIDKAPAKPAVAVTAYSYCVGTTATPLAAKATAGNSLQWYDSAGSEIAAAPTPATTTVGTQNYSVSQVSAGGCESDKATITVTISQTPLPIVDDNVSYCAGATAIALTATGTALKWYAAASGGAPLKGAPIPATIVPGQTDFYVSQTVAGCESGRARIDVTVKAIPAAPMVSALSYCVGAPAKPLTATGSGLLWYADATGGEPSKTAPSPSTTKEGIFSFYVSQNVGDCESPRAKLDVTVNAALPTPATANSLTYCYLAVVPALVATGSGSINWYDANDKPLPSAPTPSNTVGSSYKVSQTAGGCESPKVTITVTVNRTAIPVVTAAEGYCVGQTAAPLAAKGSGLQWYAAATGGKPLASAPIPATTIAGATDYYVSQTLNDCESERARITVTVNAVPDPPKVSAVSFCEGSASAPLTATGSGLKWYTTATSNDGSDTAPSPDTKVVGIKSYFVTQSSNGCESARAKLDVTVTDTPSAPTVTAAVPYCIGSTAAPLTATGTGLKWFDASNKPLSAAPTPSTTNAGSTTYKVSQTKAGCESPKATIVVTVSSTSAPAVSSTVEYCNSEVPKPLDVPGKDLKFYTSATGGTGSAIIPVPGTTANGTTTYYVTQTQNNCESDRSRIDVIVKPIPVLPTIINPAAICQLGTILPLVASVGGVTGTLKWYDKDTGGDGSAVAPRPSANDSGTLTYYVTQTVNNCESPRAALAQEVRALPAKPAVIPGVDICEKGTSNPLTATGSNLKWYKAVTGGESSTTAPTPPANAVGTTSYFVSQTTAYPAGLACEGPRSEIKVTINPLPGLPSVMATDAICQERQDKTFTFTTSDNAMSPKWYTASTGGDALGNAPTLNLKNSQEIAYYVSQTTSKGCEGGRAEVKIRVKPLPGLPTVMPLVVYCQFDSPQPLTASPVANAAIKWYGTSASGGDVTGAPTPSAANGGDTDFYVSQSLEGCEGDRNTIKVRINTTAQPVVTTPVEYCQNVDAKPLTAQGSQLKWYREAGSKDSQSTPFTPFTANVGNSAFYVTQTGGNGCESPKQKIDVKINPLPSATISGDQSISLGGSAEITITFTGAGPWDYQLSNQVSGKGETQNPVKIVVNPRTTTTYTVTEVANVCGKGIPNGSAMITVLVPTISTGNPTTASLCAGTTFTVPFQQSGTFVKNNKFNVQISTSQDTTSFRTIPTVQKGNDALATVPDTLAGGNYYVRVVGEGPQFTIAGSISPVQVTIKPKPTAILTGDATILIGESAQLSIDFGGDGPWTFNFKNGSRDSLITTSITPFIITVKPAATTTYEITNLTNACGNGRTTGKARIQVDPILGTEPGRAAAWLKVYPSPVKTIAVVEFDAPPVGGVATLQVIDVQGKVLSTQKITTDRAEVDFAPLASGLYFIKLENDGRTGVRRIVKQE